MSVFDEPIAVLRLYPSQDAASLNSGSLVDIAFELL
jgi:hypothetical protein